MVIFELLLVLAFALVGVGSVVVIVLVLRTWLTLSDNKGRSAGLRANPSSLPDPDVPAVDWITTQNLATSHVSDPTPHAAHHVGTHSSESYDPGEPSTAPEYTRSDASQASTDLWGDFGGGGAGGSWGDAGGGDLGGGAGEATGGGT